jgi:hypothetical protein
MVGLLIKIRFVFYYVGKLRFSDVSYAVNQDYLVAK